MDTVWQAADRIEWRGDDRGVMERTYGSVKQWVTSPFGMGVLDDLVGTKYGRELFAWRIMREVSYSTEGGEEAERNVFEGMNIALNGGLGKDVFEKLLAEGREAAEREKAQEDGMGFVKTDRVLEKVDLSQPHVYLSRSVLKRLEGGKYVEFSAFKHSGSVFYNSTIIGGQGEVLTCGETAKRAHNQVTNKVNSVLMEHLHRQRSLQATDMSEAKVEEVFEKNLMHVKVGDGVSILADMDAVDPTTGRYLELKTSVRCIDNPPGAKIPSSILLEEVAKHYADCRYTPADLVIGFIVGRDEDRSFVQFRIPCCTIDGLSPRTTQALSRLSAAMAEDVLLKAVITKGGFVKAVPYEGNEEQNEKFEYTVRKLAALSRAG